MAARTLTIFLFIGMLQEPPPKSSDGSGDLLPPGAVVRLGTARFRHESLTTSLVYSKDGARLLSGGYDHTVRLWDSVTGRPLALFKGHKETVRSAAFTPGENQILSTSGDGTVRLWTVKDGTGQIVVEAGEVPFRCSAVSPDGKTMACAREDGRIQVLELPGGVVLKEFKGHENLPQAMAFTGDGKLLVTGSEVGIVAAWDPRTGEERWRTILHKGPVRVLRPSPNGPTMASGSDDRSVAIFNGASGKSEFAVENPYQVWCLSYSPDGRSLAVGGWSSTFVLWDLESRKERWKTDSGLGGIRSVAFHPAGDVIAIGDQTIQFVETSTGKPRPTAECHTDWVEHIRFTPDGRRLVSSSRDGTVRLWDPLTGKSLHRLEARSVWGRAAALSHDGKRVITAGRENKIRVWDLETGRMTHELNVQMNQRFGGISFSMDGTRVLFAGIDLMWLELPDGKVLKTVRAYDRPGIVNNADAMELSSDGRILATAHYNKTILIWNAETLEQTGTIVGHLGQPGMAGFSLAFTPDGRLLAAADSDERLIRLWDVSGCRQLLAFEGHGKAAHSIALSPDGLWLASGSLDGTVRLWEVATGKELLRFLDDGVWKWVGSVSFSPDGGRVAAGMLNGTVLILSLKPERLAADLALEMLWKELSSDEADRAFRAMWTLAGRGEEAASFLRKKLDLTSVEDPSLRKLVAALGADDIEARELASKELMQAGGRAERLILETLKTETSAEVRGRLGSILTRMDAPLPTSADLLQSLRAFQALERLGATDALKEIAKHASFQRLRRDAAAAVTRLEKK